MSDVLNEFRLLNLNLPQTLTKDIRKFHISDASSYWEKIGFCITSDDQVYGVGEGIARRFGSVSKDFFLIPELCDKSIEEFFVGYDCCFARTYANQIYGFGWDVDGVLLREEGVDGIHIGPHKMDFFNNKNIIEISCGFRICLALSSDGVLYYWGKMTMPKLTAQNDLEYIWKPVVIDLEDIPRNQIKSIKTTDDTSYVTTFSGTVFKLTDSGLNKIFDTNILKEVFEDFCEVYENPNQNNVIEIKVEKRFLICETPFGVFRYGFDEKNRKLTKTEFKNMFDYSLFTNQSTYKTYHLQTNGIFVHKFVKEDENCVLIKKFDKIYSNGEQLNHNLPENSDKTFKLRGFRVTDLPKNIESDVKYYHLYEWNALSYSVLFVMSDDTVYGFGNNSYGRLGLGHDNRINEYTLIPDLCNHKIEEFYQGHYNMFARNNKNQIFGWGANQSGQLGIGFLSKDKEYLKPQKIDYFDDKHIIEISLGSHHFFALSSYGDVYTWGNNISGLMKEHPMRRISTPELIESEKKFKSIQSFSNSFAVYGVTIDGKLEFWGRNRIKPDVITQIKSMNIKRFLQINHLYVMLTDEGLVFCVFYKRENQIERLESDVQFSDICERKERIALKSHQYVYELHIDYRTEAISLKRTDFLNYFDYYFHKHNVLYKTIHISKDGFLLVNEIEFNEQSKDKPNEKILNSCYKNVYERKYDTLFEQMDKSGEGGFGQVFKVRHKLLDKLFAIKLIHMHDHGQLAVTLNEIKILSELKKQFVVQYYSAWVEAKVIDRQIVNYVYIQMQLCSQSLREVIETMDTIFENRFIAFRYLISCQLLRELTECVDYLHSLTPPIIHRDLKPENVLISDGSDGRFLKLCDFGISKPHQKEVISKDKSSNINRNFQSNFNHTRGQGDDRYMAPEKDETHEYDTKSDIYSLAVIATEIFGLTNLEYENSFPIEDQDDLLEKFLAIYENIIPENKFRKLLESLSICLFSKDFNQRPDCKQLLDRIKEWIADQNTVLMDTNDNNFKDFVSVLEKSENSFIKTFFENKLK